MKIFVNHTDHGLVNGFAVLSGLGSDEGIKRVGQA
jgi:hypothetical protein